MEKQSRSSAGSNKNSKDHNKTSNKNKNSVKKKDAPHRRRGGTSAASTRSSSSKGSSSGSHFNKKKEIVFDADARRAYLRGFSERKKQRRTYGLAMQKVKDRKAKLDERKEARKEDLKRVEEAEQQKAAYRNEILQITEKIDSRKNKNTRKDGSDDEHVEAGKDASNGDDASSQGDTNAVLDTKTYEDQATESQWGGRVIVTTSAVHLDEDDDGDDPTCDNHGDNEVNTKKQREAVSTVKKSVDKRQQYAGNVEKFMTKLKGNLPGKKKSKDLTGHHAKRKGRNGAAEMKGIGGAANLKLAQKVLSKVQAKHGGPSKGQGKSGAKKSRR